MKKLVALVLVLAIFVSTNITGFAISPNSFGANENFQLSEFEEINQSDLELSGEVTEELETESVKEILGYKIPQEPTVALDPAEAMIYEGEGNVYTILTAMDEQSRITKLYRNGVLRQKALGDRYSNLIYTELYDIELTSPDETLVQVNPESSFQKIDGETQEIKEENGFTYITVHKPVSSEVLDIPSNTGMIISQSAAASTYAASKSPMEDEPPTNDGLSKSQFSGDLDYFKLGSNSISYDGSQLYTGTLYRRISSFKHMGTAREPYKISPGTAVGTVISAIGLFLDPSKISVLLGIGSVVTTEVFNYATSVQVNIYNLDGDYKVRVNSAGNNPYFTTRRITSYYKVYNTYLDRCEYQIRRIEDGYPLSNPNLVNEGISNYGYYHFFDIIEHWAKDNIRWAYGKNFMSGTGEYKFSPEASCNRAMAITVIYRMAGQPNEGTSSGFTDVKSNDYFAKAVTWGKNHKIVSGTSSTTYSPNQNVTKEQFVLMLYNYAKYKEKNLTASGDLNKFTDGNDVSTYAKTAMKWAIGNKIVSGNNGKLNPKSTTTRAELCVMINKYYNKFG